MGRGSSAAEIASQADGAAMTYALQWGRGSSAAEITAAVGINAGQMVL